MGGAWGFALAALFAYYASAALQGFFGDSTFLQDRNAFWQLFFVGGKPNQALNFTQQVVGIFLLFSAWWMLWKFDSFFRPLTETETIEAEDDSEEPATTPEEDETVTENSSSEPETHPDREEDDFAKILGLVGNYTPEDAKSAYRTLIAQYHPDKVSLMGDEIQEVAERKAKEINEAYEHFRRKYDL